MAIKLNKRNLIIAGAAIIFSIALLGIFDSQKRNYELQITNAKLDGANIGYQAGIQEGIKQINQQIISNLFQYHLLQINMPANKNGQYDASGTEVKTMVLIPYQENATTSQ